MDAVQTFITLTFCLLGITAYASGVRHGRSAKRDIIDQLIEAQPRSESGYTVYVNLGPQQCADGEDDDEDDDGGDDEPTGPRNRISRANQHN